MRIGLVLGAGGVLGGSWLTGALHGLSEQLGWDPAGAECIVGTSAGSMVGGLLAHGVSPSYLAAHCAGAAEGGVSAALARAEASRLEPGAFRAQRGLGGYGPGSPRLALSSLARPHRYAPAAVLAGWLPHGLTSTEPLKDAIRAAAAASCVPHASFETVACDYATGRRATLGAAHGPLADAVAASCAIPGVYRPVAIGDRRFVDGAIHSMSNLDVLVGRRLDVVICLNPMSSLHAPPVRTIRERALAAIRQDAGRRLGREARAVRASGIQTLILQPMAEDLAAMSAFVPSGDARRRVVEAAAAGVRARLRGCTDLAGLERVARRDALPVTVPFRTARSPRLPARRPGAAGALAA